SRSGWAGPRAARSISVTRRRKRSGWSEPGSIRGVGPGASHVGGPHHEHGRRATALLLQQSSGPSAGIHGRVDTAQTDGLEPAAVRELPRLLVADGAALEGGTHRRIDVEARRGVVGELFERAGVFETERADLRATQRREVATHSES